MGNIIGLFSGQGSQYPGMGKELYDNFAKVKEIYECAGDILGFNLAKISFEGSEEELAQTVVAQPAIFAHSVAAYTVALEQMEAPMGVAGHSLGEFAALYAAGAYPLEDGFRIIGARGQAMNRAAAKAKGVMVAVLRKDYEIVEKACADANGFVFPVNLNLPQQTVISGEEEAVNRAVALLEEQGARMVKLGVSSAFHTTMMAPAAEEMKEAISQITFQPTSIPFFSNITGGILAIDDYPAYFAKHMVSPVRFVEEVASMVEFGMEKAVEFGPKNTVATFVKKNHKGTPVANVENMATLEALKEF